MEYIADIVLYNQTPLCVDTCTYTQWRWLALSRMREADDGVIRRSESSLFVGLWENWDLRTGGVIDGGISVLDVRKYDWEIIGLKWSCVLKYCVWICISYRWAMGKLRLADRESNWWRYFGNGCMKIWLGDRWFEVKSSIEVLCLEMYFVSSGCWEIEWFIVVVVWD